MQPISNARQHLEQLEWFRQAFIALTSDDTYPHDRQSQLYQASQQQGMDWNEIKRHIEPEAQQFLTRYIARNAHDLQAIEQMRRRLGLTAFQSPPVAAPPIATVVPSVAPAGAVPSTNLWTDLKLVVLGTILSVLLWALYAFVGIVIFAFLGIGPNPFFSFVLALGSPFAAIITTVRIMRKRRTQWQSNIPQRASRPAILSTPVLNHQSSLPIGVAVHYPPQSSTSAYQPVGIAQPASMYQAPAPPPRINGDMLLNSVLPMSGREFEYWVKDRLVELGWDNVRVTGGAGDRGVDIRGHYQGKRCIVQCKHMPGRMVPPNEIRALVGTRRIQRAQRAFMITSGQFSQQCYREVGNSPIDLWDMEGLAVEINTRRSLYQSYPVL